MHKTVRIIRYSIAPAFLRICTIDLLPEEGRVVEHGTHEELYDNDRTYREIFDASARSLNIDKISRTLDMEYAPDVANRINMTKANHDRYRLEVFDE